MSPESKALVQGTWARMAPIADVTARSFYDHLFEIDPQLRVLFHGVHLDDQRRKFVQALTMTVGSLTHMDALVPVLEDLGRRHVSYGVHDVDYETVGVALISSLQHGLGDGWTDEVKAAWVEAYKIISGPMRAAAAEAAHIPASS